MKSNKTFDAICRVIVGSLQEKGPVLSQKDINEAIAEWKKVFENTSPHMLKTILTLNVLEELDAQDWYYLKRYLEENFVVKVETGVLVQGVKQKDRDLTWWTGKKQLESDKYYIGNYMSYSKKDLPVQVLDNINEDTDVVMNNLADPTGKNFAIRGMVVGHVQSGKTANYAALICKAADAGFRFIVVIAGGQNNLRDQTQSRLEEVFVGLNSKGVGNLVSFKNEKMPICLTTKDNDFKKQIANAHATTTLDNTRNPILIVIKKHTTTLDHLLGWLNDHYANQVDKPMLVIDDESDYASINTNKEEDPTTINRKIRALLGKFSKSAYVAYTATPFANIFIDHQAKHDQYGVDLFPSDFIYALKAPDNYFGADVIFGNDEGKYVVEIPEDEVAMFEDPDEEIPTDKFIIKHRKEYEMDVLPPSLYDAINHFLLNISIRNLRNQRGKHNSMLIHISRFTDLHIQTKSLVKSYFDDLRAEVKAYGKINNPSYYQYFINSLLHTFESHLNGKIEFTFQEILIELVDVVEMLQIIDVHQKSKIKLEFRNDMQTNAIVIGGLSLSRGFTLEGLSISYFLRTTVYYDTLMQMGRWFGYRIGYQDICKVYVTNEMHNKFNHILVATEELIQRLEQMKNEQLTPEDFGLAVMQHPDSLVLVTARNKAKNAEEMYIDMDLSGTIKETSLISNNSNDIIQNDKLLKDFVKIIQKKYAYDIPFNGSYVWREVSNEDINNFVESYRFYSVDPLGLRSRMPVTVIKQYLRDNLKNWDVVLYQGDGDRNQFIAGDIKVNRQIRTIKNNKDSKDTIKYYEFKKSQVARSKPESIVVKKEYKNKKSSEMRNLMKNSVLFIHAMELKEDETNTHIPNATALSFSFNGTGKGKPTKILINAVMKQELLNFVKTIAYDEEVYENE